MIIGSHLTRKLQPSLEPATIPSGSRRLRRIRRLIPVDIAKTLACSIVGVYLDIVIPCYTAYLAKTSPYYRNCKNSLACTHHFIVAVTSLAARLTVCSFAKSLSWRTKPNLSKPVYLLPSISDYIPTRYLRSSSQLLLSKPAIRTQTAGRAFSQAAPSVWNDLPAEIRSSENFIQFRTRICFYYFKLAFNT